MGVELSLWDPVFNSFNYLPQSGIAGLYSNSIFKFLGVRFFSWLGRVFIAAQAFLYLRQVGAALRLRCMDFYLQWLLSLRRMGSRADWLQSAQHSGSVVVAPRLGVSQVVLVIKNLPANAGDLRDAGLTPGLGRSPGGGHGNPLQYSCLENPMDRGAWRATVHGASRIWTWLKRLSTHTQARELCLTSCTTWASLLHGMWGPPRPGIEPVSPALAGGFFTTEPSRKPYFYVSEKRLSYFSQ